MENPRNPPNSQRYSISRLTGMIGFTRQAYSKRQKYQSKARVWFYSKTSDSEVLAQIQGVIKLRPTYGYKRVTARVNQNDICDENYPKKRIY